MKLYAFALAVIILVVAFSTAAAAQEDTTPPVLLDFDFSPTVLNVTVSSGGVRFVVEGSDDLSGIQTVNVTGGDPNFIGWGLFLGLQPDGLWVGDLTIPQFSPLGTWTIGAVTLTDTVGNKRIVSDDLAAMGFANSFETVAGPATDTDGDGVFDLTDNCPDASNANQEDVDLDLIGDACDPFPNDRDNEQAQCDEDLSTCLDGSALAQCLDDSSQCAASEAQCLADLAVFEADPINQDADADGIPDPLDTCPDTVVAPVDSNGCSLDQFCALIDLAADRKNRKACKKADWNNDEPIMRSKERDCTLSQDRTACVPTDSRF